MHFSLLSSIALLACLGRIEAEERACNNSPRLCDKPYNTITYLGAHDSPFVRNASNNWSSFGNQYFPTATQLDAGVRLVSAQVHVAANEQTKERELHICHTSCSLFDVGTLLSFLLQIRTWLDANPNEVVTILLVNSDGIEATELESIYSQADLAHYGYVPPDIHRPPPLSNETNPTWPTLSDMIDKGTRLVSFVQPLNTDGNNAPYLLNEFDFVWENSYNVTSPSQFTCTPDRPEGQTIYGMHTSGRLFLMNHFLYWQQAFGIQVPDDRVINSTNAWQGSGALGEHMVTCANQVTRQPTFVLVDFFNVGPAMETVDTFNVVKAPVGRLNVSSGVLNGKHVSGAARTKRIEWMALGVAVAVIVIINLLG